VADPSSIFCHIEEGERINAILPVKAFEEDKYVFLVTKPAP